MCGITFMRKTLAKENPKNLLSAFSHSFHTQISRGGDASGIIIGKRGGVSILKGEGLFPSDIIVSRFSELTRSDVTFLAGHCRFATAGDKKRNRNNHPIIRGDWYLIHNGVITHEGWIKKMRTECDSEVLLILWEESGFNLSKFEAALRHNAAEIGSASFLLAEKGGGRAILGRLNYQSLHSMTSAGWECYESAGSFTGDSLGIGGSFLIDYKLRGGLLIESRRIEITWPVSKIRYYGRYDFGESLTGGLPHWSVYGDGEIGRSRGRTIGDIDDEESGIRRLNLSRGRYSGRLGRKGEYSGV